eukprot:CAMPEP_0197523014 /NCGR_PEP_ID=MMETSP1318-20131121/8033_1 /TAXON_ID=552666 /ORGANISM="Partenskyella glossopodia, Strain RCC365" /LENGTH=735 /DNA_ID=CAMNT_0043075567 /DNA_START=147 /DNA_END=2354 /DNA_ORIENTATION=+
MRASVWLWWFAAITLVLGDMIPPLKPTNVKEFNTPPEGKPPPPLEDLPEALADIGVEASVSGGTDVFPLWNDPDMFPSEPPEPPPSSDPPPISPVGRWLHSAVIMGTGMYVYGGVASYNRMLDNDVWVYDLGAQDWHELQASFVPAFGNGRPDPTASEATRPKGTPAAPPFRSSPATSRAGVVAIPLKKGEDPNYMDPNLARQPKQNKPIRITYLESFVPSPLKATSYTNYDAQMHKRQHHQREQQLQQQNEQITRDVGLVANLPQPPLSSVPGGSMELIEEAANISPDTNSANSGENIDERSPFSFFAGKSSSSATAATIAMLETQATRRRHGRHGRRHHHNYRHSHGHSHSHSQESRTGTNTSHTSQQQQQQQQQHGQLYQYERSHHSKQQKAAAGGSLTKVQKPVFVMADLWRYDIIYKKWEAINAGTSVPEHRYLHSAVSLSNGKTKDSMIVFGGVGWSNNILNDVWIFSTKSNKWTQSFPKGSVEADTLPAWREGHSACVMPANAKAETQMYMFGGISYQFMPFNDMWIYDAKKGSWAKQKPSGDTPEPRWLHTCTFSTPPPGKKPGELDWTGFKPKMYVFGGVTVGSVPLDNLYEYDPSTKKWTLMPQAGFAPFPRMLHNMMFTYNRIFVSFGAANNVRFEDMYYYDINEQRWHEMINTEPFPFAREGASAILVEPPPSTSYPDYRQPWSPPVSQERKKFNRPKVRYRHMFNADRFFLVFGGASTGPVH